MEHETGGSSGGKKQRSLPTKASVYLQYSTYSSLILSRPVTRLVSPEGLMYHGARDSAEVKIFQEVVVRVHTALHVFKPTKVQL